ncbi:TniB family NTP-binding protein [Embleya sp. AB8]|uniref:TniB family NTP-binding protein n=1 Tax=Embleya sp. AB8 TaxID=3156304 RepID=UPI003C707BC7
MASPTENDEVSQPSASKTRTRFAHAPNGRNAKGNSQPRCPAVSNPAAPQVNRRPTERHTRHHTPKPQATKHESTFSIRAAPQVRGPHPHNPAETTQLTEIPWIHRDHVHRPFDDHIWRRVRAGVDGHRDRERHEAEPAEALDQLMRRMRNTAGTLPRKRGRRGPVTAPDTAAVLPGPAPPGRRCLAGRTTCTGRARGYRPGLRRAVARAPVSGPVETAQASGAGPVPDGGGGATASTLSPPRIPTPRAQVRARRRTGGAGPRRPRRGPGSGCMTRRPRQSCGEHPGRRGPLCIAARGGGGEGGTWVRRRERGRVSCGGGGDEAGQRSLTTWEGGRDFVAAPVPAPLPPGAEPRGLEERLAYPSRFVTVRAPTIDALAKSVRTLMILGRHQDVTARPGLIVTGPAAAGKTTTLLQVGRACHLAHAARGRTGISERVPVAYVLVPPAATAKTPAAEFARYLGVPITDRMIQARIVDAVCHVHGEAGVRLVMIDEIRRRGPRTTAGAETADLLKDLTERIGATFVYAGIDVAGTPLFAGVRGAQLAGRACPVECGAFPARVGGAEPFPDLVAAMESALDLRAHRAGTLPRLVSYPPRPHRRADREPGPADPPGRDRRDPRRHRTHHRGLFGRRAARSPRRGTPPAPRPRSGAHTARRRGGSTRPVNANGKARGSGKARAGRGREGDGSGGERLGPGPTWRYPRVPSWGVLGVAPVAFESTASYLGRLAGAYRLGVAQLPAASVSNSTGRDGGRDRDRRRPASRFASTPRREGVRPRSPGSPTTTRHRPLPRPITAPGPGPTRSPHRVDTTGADDRMGTTGTGEEDVAAPGAAGGRIRVLDADEQGVRACPVCVRRRICGVGDVAWTCPPADRMWCPRHRYWVGERGPVAGPPRHGWATGDRPRAPGPPAPDTTP